MDAQDRLLRAAQRLEKAKERNNVSKQNLDTIKGVQDTVKNSVDTDDAGSLSGALGKGVARGSYRVASGLGGLVDDVAREDSGLRTSLDMNDNQKDVFNKMKQLENANNAKQVSEDQYRKGILSKEDYVKVNQEQDGIIKTNTLSGMDNIIAAQKTEGRDLYQRYEDVKANQTEHEAYFGEEGTNTVIDDMGVEDKLSQQSFQKNKEDYKEQGNGTVLDTITSTAKAVLDNPDFALGMTGESVPYMAGGIGGGAARLTGAKALAKAGTGVADVATVGYFGSTLDEGINTKFKEQGALSGADIAETVGYAAGASALERLGGEAQAVGARAGASLVGNGLKGAKGAAVRKGGDFALGTITEGATEFGQTMAEAKAQGHEVDVHEAAEAFVLGAASGGMASPAIGAFGGVAEGVGSARDKINSPEAKIGKATHKGDRKGFDEATDEAINKGDLESAYKWINDFEAAHATNTKVTTKDLNDKRNKVVDQVEANAQEFEEIFNGKVMKDGRTYDDFTPEEKANFDEAHDKALATFDNINKLANEKDKKATVNTREELDKELDKENENYDAYEAYKNADNFHRKNESNKEVNTDGLVEEKTKIKTALEESILSRGEILANKKTITNPTTGEDIYLKDAPEDVKEQVIEKYQEALDTDQGKLDAINALEEEVSNLKSSHAQLKEEQAKEQPNEDKVAELHFDIEQAKEEESILKNMQVVASQVLQGSNDSKFIGVEEHLSNIAAARKNKDIKSAKATQAGMKKFSASHVSKLRAVESAKATFESEAATQFVVRNKEGSWESTDKNSFNKHPDSFKLRINANSNKLISNIAKEVEAIQGAVAHIDKNVSYLENKETKKSTNKIEAKKPEITKAKKEPKSATPYEPKNMAKNTPKHIKFSDEVETNTSGYALGLGDTAQYIIGRGNVSGLSKNSMMKGAADSEGKIPVTTNRAIKKGSKVMVSLWDDALTLANAGSAKKLANTKSDDISIIQAQHTLNLVGRAMSAKAEIIFPTSELYEGKEGNARAKATREFMESQGYVQTKYIDQAGNKLESGKWLDSGDGAVGVVFTKGANSSFSFETELKNTYDGTANKPVTKKATSTKVETPIETKTEVKTEVKPEAKVEVEEQAIEIITKPREIKPKEKVVNKYVKEDYKKTVLKHDDFRRVYLDIDFDKLSLKVDNNEATEETFTKEYVRVLNNLRRRTAVKGDVETIARATTLYNMGYESIGLTKNIHPLFEIAENDISIDIIEELSEQIFDSKQLAQFKVLLPALQEVKINFFDFFNEKSGNKAFDLYLDKQTPEAKQKHIRGSYEKNTNLVSLNASTAMPANSESSATLLHELIHAVMIKGVENASDEELDSMMDTYNDLADALLQDPKKDLGVLYYGLNIKGNNPSQRLKALASRTDEIKTTATAEDKIKYLTEMHTVFLTNKHAIKIAKETKATNTKSIWEIITSKFQTLLNRVLINKKQDETSYSEMWKQVAHYSETYAQPEFVSKNTDLDFSYNSLTENQLHTLVADLLKAPQAQLIKRMKIAVKKLNIESMAVYQDLYTYGVNNNNNFAMSLAQTAMVYKQNQENINQLDGVDYIKDTGENTTITEVNTHASVDEVTRTNQVIETPLFNVGSGDGILNISEDFMYEYIRSGSWDALAKHVGKESLSENEINQLKAFTALRDNIAFKIKDNNFNPTDDSVLKDIMQEGDSQFSEQWITAITYGLYEFIKTEGKTTQHSKETIGALFFNDRKKRIPYSVLASMRTLGYNRAFLSDKIGSNILRAYKVNAKEDTTILEKDALVAGIGQVAVLLAENSNDGLPPIFKPIKKESSLPYSQLLSMMGNAVDLNKINEIVSMYNSELPGDIKIFNVKDVSDIKDTIKSLVEAESKYNLPKYIHTRPNIFNTDKGVHMSPHLVNILNGIKQEGDEDILNLLMNGETNLSYPSDTPIESLPTKFQGTDTEINEETKETQRKFANRGHKIEEGIVQSVSNLAPDDLLQILGYASENDLNEMHKDERMVEEAEKKIEKVSVSNMIDYALKQGSKEFFYTPTVSENNRSTYKEYGFNIQGNKFARAVAHMSGWKSNVNKKDSVSEENNHTGFMMALAEHLEGVTEDFAGFQHIRDKYTASAVNADKVSYKDLSPIMSDLVNGTNSFSEKGEYHSEHKTLMEAVASYNALQENTHTEEDVSNIKTWVKKGGMKALSMRALHEIAQYHKSGSTFETHLPRQSDGVTSGPATNHVLLDAWSVEEMRGAGYSDVKVEGMQETKERTTDGKPTASKNILDFYENTAKYLSVATDTLRSMTQKQEGVAVGTNPVSAGMAKYYKKIGLRKGAKVFLTPFNYGAGMMSIINALRNDYVGDIEKQFFKLARAKNTGKKDFSKSHNEFINYLNDMNVSVVNSLANTVNAKQQVMSELTLFNLAYPKLAIDATSIASRVPEGGKLNRVQDFVTEAVYKHLDLNQDVDIFKDGGAAFYVDDNVIPYKELSDLLFGKKSKLIRLKDNYRKLTSKAQESINSFTEKSYSETFPYDIVNMLGAVSDLTQASIAVQTINKTSSKMLDRRNKAVELDTQIFRSYKALEENVIKDKFNKEVYGELTQKEVKELKEILKDYLPSVAHVMTGDNEVGTVMATTDKVVQFNKRVGVQLRNTRQSASKKNKEFVDASTSSGFKTASLESLGVGGNSRTIQSGDASVTIRTMAEHAASNYHDANGVGIFDFANMAKTQNNAMWQAVTEFQFGLEHLEGLIRTLKGFNAFGYKIPNKLHTINDTYNEDLVVRSLTASLQPLLDADIAKLHKLKEMSTITHYAGEGGAKQIGQAELDTINDIIQKTENRTEVLQEELNNLLAAQGEVETKTESAPETKPVKDVKAKATKVEKITAKIDRKTLSRTGKTILQRVRDNSIRATKKNVTDEWKKTINATSNKNSKLRTLLQEVQSELKLDENLFIEGLHKNGITKKIEINNKAEIALKNLKELLHPEMEGKITPSVNDNISIYMEGFEKLYSNEVIFEDSIYNDYQESTEKKMGIDTIIGLISNEEDAHLGKVINTFIKPMYERIADSLVTGVDSATYWNDKIDNYSPYTSGAEKAGFNMTTAQSFVTDSIYSILNNITNNNEQDNAVYRQLNESYKDAKDTLRVRDFYQGDWNNATNEDKKLAQKKHSYLFSEGLIDTDYLARFSGLVLTNPQVSKLLNVKTKREEENTLSDNILNWVSDKIEWVIDSEVKTSETKISPRLESLYSELAEVVQRNQSQAERSNLVVKTFSKLDNTINNIFEKMRGSSANMDIVIDLVHGTKEDKPTALDSLLWADDRTRPNKLSGNLRELYDDLTGTASKERGNYIRKFITATKRIEDKRTSIHSGHKQSLQDMFKDYGKVKEFEKTILDTFVRSNAHVLGSNALDFVFQDDLRKSQMDNLKKEIMQMNRGDEMLMRADALAHYQIHNQATIPLLVKNCEAIVSGHGLKKDRNWNKAELATIKQYTALAAISKTDSSIRDKISKLGENKGLNELVEYTRELEKLSRKTMVNNPNARIDGFIPNLFSNNKEIKAVLKGEVSYWENQGYTVISDLSQDSADPSNETSVLMFINDSGMQQYVSGGMSLEDSMRKGTVIVDKHSGRLGTTKDLSERNFYKELSSYRSNGKTTGNNYMIPSYAPDGDVATFGYEMHSNTLDSYAGRTSDISEVLSQHFSKSIVSKEFLANNMKIVDDLIDYHDVNKDNVLLNGKFVTLSAKGNEEKSRELWHMLPEATKEYIYQETGEYALTISKDEVSRIMGMSKINPLKFLDSDSNGQMKPFAEFLTQVTGKRTKPVLRQILRTWFDFVKMVKDFVVIRNPAVIMGNILSNSLLSMASGVPVKEAMKDATIAYRYSSDYVKAKNKLSYLDGLSKGRKLTIEEMSEYSRASTTIKKSPIAHLVEEGMLPTMVLDASLYEDEEPKSYVFEQAEKQWNKLPTNVRNVADLMMFNKKSSTHTFMTNAVQQSDFVFKYAMYKHLTRNGTKHKDAMDKVTENFIDYDVPTNQWSQLGSDMGFHMFNKFMYRIQRVIGKLIREKPASLAAVDLSATVLFGIPSLTSLLLVNKLATGYIPLSNPFGIGGAIGGIVPLWLASSVFS